MTIKLAKALPRYLLKDYIDFKVDNISPEYVSDSVKDLNEIVRKFNNVYVISVTDTLNTSLNVGAWFKNYKTYKFDDFDPISRPQLNIDSIKDRIITQDQVQEIVEFLCHANDSSNKSEILLVNCEMGVSRSGAVVTFAKEIFNIPRNEHKKHNPWIRPNKHILQMLHETYAKKNLV